MGQVYAIVNLVNGKRYVGSSKNPPRRTYRHWNDLRNGEHHSVHLQRAFNKYGESAFAFKVLEEVANKLLSEREQYWMDTYKSADRNHGYNIADVVGQPSHTPESRAKQAATMKAKYANGLRIWCEGKTLSEDYRRKISEGTKAAMVDPTIRDKCRYWKGKHQSEETNRKRSEAQKSYYKDHPPVMLEYSQTEQARQNRSLALKAFYASDAGRECMKRRSENHKPSQDTRNKRSETMKRMWRDRGETWMKSVDAMRKSNDLRKAECLKSAIAVCLNCGASFNWRELARYKRSTCSKKCLSELKAKNSQEAVKSLWQDSQYRLKQLQARQQE